MDNFSHNAISATWSIFQSLTPRDGVSRGQSGSPSALLFERNECVLSVRLEATGISYQVTSESRTGFPKPIKPRALEVRGTKDTPVVVDGQEKTPEEAFDDLMDWFYDASQTSAGKRRPEGC
jgi:hypothetical protein